MNKPSFALFKKKPKIVFFLHQPPIWPYQTIRLTIETEVKCWHKFESWYHREGWIKIENKVRLSMQHWGTPALTQMDPLEWPFKITFISRIEIWKFFHPFVIWFITLLVRLHFFYLWQMNDFRKKATLIYCHKCTTQLKISIYI